MILSVILLYVLMILLSTVSEQAFDLQQQLKLPSVLEFDPLGTIDLGRKWLVDFNAGKTTCLFDQSYDFGAIYEKRDWSVIEEISSFTVLGN